MKMSTVPCCAPGISPLWLYGGRKIPVSVKEEEEEKLHPHEAIDKSSKFY